MADVVLSGQPQDQTSAPPVEVAQAVPTVPPPQPEQSPVAAPEPAPMPESSQDIAPPDTVDHLQPDESGAYVTHRENLSGSNELDALMQRVDAHQKDTAPAGQDAQQPAAQQPDTTPATPTDFKIEVHRLREGGYGGWVNGALMVAANTPEATQAMAEAAVEKIKNPSFASKAGAVAKDVGRGVIEAPRQAVGGASDAVHETTKAIDDLAQWLNDNVADLNVSVPLPGVDTKDNVDINPTALIRDVLPNIDKANSVTGGIVRSVAQFVTGFWGAGKFFKGLGMAAPASASGKLIEAAGKGALADFTVFDPTEERLSNLVQSVPALQNPVTEYLAADPNDSKVEGRLKSVLEGLGLGAMTEGFLASLRGLRGIRKARMGQTAETMLSEQKAKYGEINNRDWVLLGDPESQDFLIKRPTVSGKVRDAAGNVPDVSPKEIAQSATGITDADISAPSRGDTYINWARINSPEDIKQAMQAVADMGKKGVDKARRGVRTNETTAAAADKLDPFDVLVSRRPGQPLNAEESLALRQLWTQATETLTETAKKAADNPGEANLFAFRKMLAIQSAIQNEVIAARTETARALQSWSIPAGGNVERARAVQDVLAQNADDPNVHRELARRIAALGEAGELETLNEVARRSVTARTYDAVVQAWINGLLSGPKTHLVNMMSNTSVIFLSMAERKTAAHIAELMGDANSVQLGEATAQWFGMIQGMKDALRISSKAEKMGSVWKSLKTGESGFGLQKVDQPRQGALASEVWNVASDTPLGRSLDALNVVTQIPGRALGAEDELFKTIGYRMELHAQALRRATSEVNAGKIKPENLKARINEIVQNPPQEIRLASLDAATYQTFNNAPGEISKVIMKYRNVVPVLGPLTAPFVRTVGNIMKYSFERTPLAPLIPEVRANIAAGGARRDLALARISLGSMLMAVSADMAISGDVTGKGPADTNMRATERRAGVQPYSVKVGDRWYAYNRMDPIGTLIGLSADMVDILSNGDVTDDKWHEDVEKAIIATAAAIGANAMNKSYLTGMSNFVEALSDSTRNSEYWAEGVAGSFMPTVAAETRRLDDPYMRDVRSMWEAIANRTPGLSKDLPLRRDLWGRPIQYRSGLGAAYDAVSPIYSSKEDPTPIDKELLRLGNGPSMMPRRSSFDGAVINLDQYDGAYSRLVELAGNGLKLPKYGNKGALDALNDIITGKSPFSAVYNLRSDGPDGGKMTFIRSLVSEYRNAAKKQLLAEYPAITVEVRRKLEAQKKWSVQ